GVARMNLIKFSIFTFVGAFPWTLGFAWGGYVLGDNYHAIREVTRPLDVPVVAAVLALIGWFLWRRISEIRAESAERKRNEANAVQATTEND
ncbi:MAG: DedA family protein, partial [Chloroflexota bacterium]